MIVIVDYGMGNAGSILNRIKRMGAEAVVSSDVQDLARADKIILPGVGYFAAGMDNLKNYGLLNVLEQKVMKEKVPILGICLGMQLFTGKSEEGNAEGLQWLDADTVRFDFQTSNLDLRVPHIGWKTIESKQDCTLLDGLSIDAEFYFVHSYHVCCYDTGNIVATTRYGYDFASVIQKDNIFGTQFHPEKSHHDGITFLKNFVERV
jgi:glutamine amidotransferase